MEVHSGSVPWLYKGRQQCNATILWAKAPLPAATGLAASTAWYSKSLRSRKNSTECDGPDVAHLQTCKPQTNQTKPDDENTQSKVRQFLASRSSVKHRWHVSEENKRKTKTSDLKRK
uniref:Uncharacterized protein n=1 Tax=Anguilla anguilla TaxID=7936 RepID=A0A0E9X3B8_ANGAN